MSFAGHVLDMIKRQKMNRQLQRSARENYKSKLENFRNTKLNTTKKFNHDKFPEIDSEEKKRIKQEVKEQFKKAAVKAYLKTGISLLILVVTLQYLHNLIFG